ncbi:transcription initiation factor TFIID subunit 4-like [Sapajus apella]|uniref:Transcription initiation factor TFIID subunit 4-like n=1 Tax=Sapajus apella TaxID=9515 RepID=A0A6J3J5U6_SAPAP|nr:transcription initiation factor TFIID subunit 4-like [Sapajus apella]
MTINFEGLLSEEHKGRTESNQEKWRPEVPLLRPSRPQRNAGSTSLHKVSAVETRRPRGALSYCLQRVPDTALTDPGYLGVSAGHKPFWRSFHPPTSPRPALPVLQPPSPPRAAPLSPAAPPASPRWWKAAPGKRHASGPRSRGSGQRSVATALPLAAETGERRATEEGTGTPRRRHAPPPPTGAAVALKKLLREAKRHSCCRRRGAAEMEGTLAMRPLHPGCGAPASARPLRNPALASPRGQTQRNFQGGRRPRSSEFPTPNAPSSSMSRSYNCLK